MLELRHVTLEFATPSGSIKALDDVSLTFSDAGLVVVMGPSGCGKSTLLNVLALLRTPTSGNYLYRGTNTGAWSPRRRQKIQKEEIAVLFQHFHLLEGFTASENVAAPLCILGKDRKTVASDVNHVLASFGLLPLANQVVDTLSGGEKQRVALMRALVKRAPILLADEPTGALDGHNATVLMETLARIAKEKLVIVVTHNHDLAKRYADRLVTIEHGRITGDVIIHEGSPLTFPSPRYNRTSDVTMFIRRLLRIDGRRLLWSALSLLIGIVSSMLTIGLSHGAAILEHQRPAALPDCRVVHVRQQEKIGLSHTPLNLIRYRRPPYRIIEMLNEAAAITYFDVSLRGILSQSPSFRYGGKTIHEARFEPLYSFQNYGFDDVGNGVLINEKMATLLGVSSEDDLNYLVYETTATASYADEVVGTLTDTLSFHSEFEILAVIADARLQQVPTAYYAHPDLARMLMNTFLPRLSEAMGRPISWYERVRMASEEEAITNQEMFVVMAGETNLERLFEQSNVYGNLSFHGSYFTERLLIASLMKTLSYGMTFFVSLAALSSCLTLGLTLTHFLNRNRRRIAILWQLGLDRRSIRKIFTTIGFVIVGTALAVAVPTAPIMAKLANEIIMKTSGLADVIVIPWIYWNGVFLGLPILIIVIVSAISFAVAAAGTHAVKYMRLVDELSADD